MTDPHSTGDGAPETPAEALAAAANARDFDAWLAEQNRQRNRDDGYDDTRNDPTYIPDPDDHSPSSLVQCHRRIYYRALNAPAESGQPLGFFDVGHFFEEDRVEPWLADLLERAADGDVPHVDFDDFDDFDPDDLDLDNTVHVTVVEDEFEISGSTDPVAFHGGRPLLLVEVKSTKDLQYVRSAGEPDESHLAQAHAYMKGLQAEFDLDAPPLAMFVYGERSSWDVETFLVEFDEAFYRDVVVPWAEQQTDYRSARALPPQEPKEEYECFYCEFRYRCGNAPEWHEATKNDETVAERAKFSMGNQNSKGFLPLAKYPATAVYEHVLTYPDVPLTPSLAYHWPEFVADPPEEFRDRIDERGAEAYLERKFDLDRMDLTELPKREVADWLCPGCGNEYAFDAFGWDGDVHVTPTCPRCHEEDGINVSLRGPKPRELGFTREE